MIHFGVKLYNKLPQLVVHVGVASGTGSSTAPLPLPLATILGEDGATVSPTW